MYPLTGPWIDFFLIFDMKHRNPLPDGAKNNGRRPTMPNTLLLHVFVMFSQQTRGRGRVRLIQFRPLDSVTNNCAPRSANLIRQYVRSIFVPFQTNKGRRRVLLTKLWPPPVFREMDLRGPPCEPDKAICPAHFHSFSNKQGWGASPPS